MATGAGLAALPRTQSKPTWKRGRWRCALTVGRTWGSGRESLLVRSGRRPLGRVVGDRTPTLALTLGQRSIMRRLAQVAGGVGTSARNEPPSCHGHHAHFDRFDQRHHSRPTGARLPPKSVAGIDLGTSPACPQHPCSLRGCSGIGVGEPLLLVDDLGCAL